MSGAVAGAITLAAWLWLYVLFHPHPPAIDRRPHEVTGEMLAAEAARLLEPGARLVVLARDPEPFEVPASTAQLDGFLRALKKAGKHITLTQGFKLNPLRPAGVPSGEFFELLRKSAENDVIVSFLRPPVLSREQVAKLGAKRPRILALCPGALRGQVDLKQLFDENLLSAAVVSRDDAPAHAGPGNEQSAFEQRFWWITPANLSDLPQATVVRH
jgi:hypothetical protein